MAHTQEQLDEQICQLTTTICETFSGVVLASDKKPFKAKLASGVGGCIHISGEWSGTIFVQYSNGMVTQLVNGMVTPQNNNLTVNDAHDVLGEILNMIGGNMKSILPGPSRLSLPHISANEPVPEEIMGCDWISFSSNGDYLWLLIKEGTLTCKTQ